MSLLLSTLDQYKEQIDQLIVGEIPRLGEEGTLRDACAYALEGSGKRIRPAIVLAVAKALGLGLDARGAALCVEYHHTASLIADDLPCMDDDDLRRGKPSCHKAFGEATALLASYALIAAGYEQLVRAGNRLAKAPPPFCLRADEACCLAVENVSQNTGLTGIIGGQFLDLNPSNVDRSFLQETIERKTGALFETSFLLGWLFGGGDLEKGKIKAVKQLGMRFGTIFQIVDDFLDLEEDRAAGRTINAPLLLGIDQAHTWLEEEKLCVDQMQKELRLDSSELAALSQGLLELVSS